MLERFQAHLDQWHWKELAKRVVNRLGYSVARVDPTDRSGGETENPLLDQQRIFQFANAGKPGVVFDVGANIGQSVTKYRSFFPHARIHAFEPLPKAYRQLLLAADAAGNVVVNQSALHAAPGVKKFYSNRGGANQTSSFLPPATDVRHSFPEHAFEVEQVLEVNVTTLDDYCAEHSIEHIDVLKMDTQGTELDILRGANRMLERRAITMAYVEIVFAPVYAGNALYHHIASQLETCGMDLFRIYTQCYGTAGRHIGGDALFVERSVLKAYLDQNFGKSYSESSSPDSRELKSATAEQADCH
jgi:FkbM family methyltransferase